MKFLNLVHVLYFELSNSIVLEIDFNMKKKKIYIPLKKILDLVIKRVKDLDIHVPLSRIARMDLSGMFEDETLAGLRKYIYEYLKLANEYRKVYFEFIKKNKVEFDREMTKDGSFAPGIKQYDSLKNQLGEALLKTNGKVWITSYDQYLPTIREHSDKRKKEPRTGNQMFEQLQKKFKNDLKDIKKSQMKTIKKSKSFQKDLDMAVKNPELGWREWVNIKSSNK
ncbi:MAG: hypothetical protein ACFFG0_34570 [Candidatus Thorarchaeota archaeon]